MGKSARKFLNGDSWNITETGVSVYRKQAESIFSLANEYMGVRGCFDEGTSAESLSGTYFNGIYEYAADASAPSYKGIATRTHYMVNSVDFFRVKIRVGEQILDTALSSLSNVCRTLSLKEGKLYRTLDWKLPEGTIKVSFCRFLDMENYRRAYQQISFVSNFDCEISLDAEADFNGTHWAKKSRWIEKARCADGLECATASTNQSVACAFFVDADGRKEDGISNSDRRLVKRLNIKLKCGKASVFTRYAALYAARQGEGNALDLALEELNKQRAEGFDAASRRCSLYWKDFWDKCDIVIDGDEENAQGIRFCIFQLQQTYHGAAPTDNIGAKGLTGEAYSGHAFWDTETYCLPYYIFTNPLAAKDLLKYRYATLKEAKARALQLDCNGACFPIATLSGEEACTLWQHASLQLQPTTAVAYGIYHYVNVTKDTDFLKEYGAEMLVEICRFLASRGQWDGAGEYFGYYAVMGPDEFQMMVNHNCYTNYMAKKTFLYTLETLAHLDGGTRRKIEGKTGLTASELSYFEKCADKMKILYDSKTMIYEQHEGYYGLPHIDVDSIPDADFPLYSHWSYDRIYRNDMIKQPDVLMFQFLYSNDFSFECKKANYEFYEPRCIHESSLSPSVHSILASGLNKDGEALSFFGFATRMDLDDYNRNTAEGLHMTSIAAAWMNIIYGFGGLKSDGELSVAPKLPKNWKGYSFSLFIENCNVKISVGEKVVLSNTGAVPVTLTVYGKRYAIADTVTVERPL